MALLDRFWLTQDPAVRQHKLLHLRLKTCQFHADVPTIDMPPSFPVDDTVHVDEEDVRKLAQEVRIRHLPGTRGSLSGQQKNSDRAFSKTVNLDKYPERLFHAVHKERDEVHFFLYILFSMFLHVHKMV